MATLGFNRTRLGGLSVSDMAFAASACIILAKLLNGQDHDLAPPASRRTPTIVLAGSLLLLTAGTVSSFRSWNPEGSLQVVLRFAWLTLLWFWILRSVARDRGALAKLLAGWRFTVLVSSVFAVLGEIGLYQPGVANNEGRQVAFFFHPNELAGLLVFGLPLFIFDVPRKPGDGRPVAMRVALTGLVVYAITTTGSMTALFSTVVCFVTAGFVALASKAPRTKRRRNPLVPMAIAFGSVVGILLLSASDLPVIERLTRFQEGDAGIESSVETRANRNEAILSTLDETLLVGTGLQLQGQGQGSVLKVGQVRAAAPGVVEGAHNMFLKLVHEGGTPALIGLLTVVASALRMAWRVAINTRGGELYPVAVALLTSIVAANAFANFGPFAYQRYYWVTVGLVTCLWAVRRQELREMAAAAASDGPAPAPAPAPVASQRRFAVPGRPGPHRTQLGPGPAGQAR